MEKKLFCGAAKRCITPPETLLPRLYGLMGRKFCTVLDDIYLRVIAFSDGENRALIVGFDLDKAPRPEENLRALAEATGVGEENILYFGIHTHTAPLCGPRPPFEQPKDDDTAAATAEYEAFVQERLLDAAKEAVSSLQPARIGTGRGESYLNVNRNQHYIVKAADGKEYDLMGLGADPLGEVDHSVFVLKIESLAGEPIALFVNYAMHNVVMICNEPNGDGLVGISADVGGNVSRCLEEQFGGVAVWSSGAAGDVNPIMMNQYYYPDPATGVQREEKIHDAQAAQAMLKIMVGRHVEDIKGVLRTLRCDTDAAAVGGTVAWSETETEGDNPPWKIRLQALKLGNLGFMGIGGELYTTLGRAIRESSPMADTVVINHNVSLLHDSGYILDDAALRRAHVKAPGMERACFVPGGNRAVNLPGTVKASLEKHTKEMFGALNAAGEPRPERKGPGGPGGRPAPIREFSVEDKGNGIFEITAPPMRFKQYLVVGEEKALLIDTGFGMGSLKAVVDKLTDKPIILVNTHGHPDHGGGNFEFGAPYLHPMDRALYAYKCAAARFEEASHWPVEGEVTLQPYESETKPLADGQCFELGGRVVEALYTPGHTAGSMCLYDRLTGALFTGDNTNAHGVFIDNQSPATVTEYLASLKKMKAKNPTVLYTGHMPGAVEPQQIDKLIACAEAVLAGNRGEYTEGRMNSGWKIEIDGVSFTYVDGKV